MGNLGKRGRSSGPTEEGKKKDARLQGAAANVQTKNYREGLRKLSVSQPSQGLSKGVSLSFQSPQAIIC